MTVGHTKACPQGLPAEGSLRHHFFFDHFLVPVVLVLFILLLVLCSLFVILSLPSPSPALIVSFIVL